MSPKNLDGLYFSQRSALVKRRMPHIVLTIQQCPTRLSFENDNLFDFFSILC